MYTLRVRWLRVRKQTLNGVRRRGSWAGWFGFGCLAASLGLLLLLKALPYSSVHLVTVSPSETTRRPSPEFTLGPLTWPVTELAQAPALQPFREAFRAACGEATGLAAAACASAVLAERVPVGEPTTEFVSDDFEPATHFEEHMAGAPGHCLTRGAILATQLLSVGIPARIVQLVPARGNGHTLVSVWDDGMGWIVVDPTSGGFVTSSGNPGSATTLLASAPRVEWNPLGQAPASVADSARMTRYFQSLLTGGVLYPEPWLYLRHGDRLAPWPLRGLYANAGRPLLWLGPLQQLLGVAIPGLALGGFCLLMFSNRAGAFRNPATARRAPSAPTEGGFEVVPPALLTTDD